MKIEIDNHVDGFIPPKTLITQIAKKLTKKNIELLIVSADEIMQINQSTRNINKPTDVLSFPLQGSKKDPLGSIVICSDFVQQKAKELGHSEDDEFALLFIHGLLHLLGYDHEVDNGEMRKKEKQLIQEFHLPKSLIIRNEE